MSPYGSAYPKASPRPRPPVRWPDSPAESALPSYDVITASQPSFGENAASQGNDAYASLQLQGHSTTLSSTLAESNSWRPAPSNSWRNDSGYITPYAPAQAPPTYGMAPSRQASAEDSPVTSRYTSFMHLAMRDCMLLLRCYSNPKSLWHCRYFHVDMMCCLHKKVARPGYLVHPCAHHLRHREQAVHRHRRRINPPLLPLSRPKMHRSAQSPTICHGLSRRMTRDLPSSKVIDREPEHAAPFPFTSEGLVLRGGGGGSYKGRWL